MSARVLDALGRRNAGAPLCPHRVQPAHRARVPFGVGADRIVQRRLVLQQLDHLLVERAYGVGLVEGKALARGRGPVAEAVPDLALLVSLATEENALSLRGQHEHGFGLGKAGEVVEMAVEAVREVRVAVAHALRSRRHDGHPFGHGLRKAPAALEVLRGGIVRFHRSVRPAR